MSMKVLRSAVATIVLLYTQSTLAYEIETHAGLSRAAANASILKDTSSTGVLKSMGLNYPISENINQIFPNTKTGERKSIVELIADGSRFEDGLQSDCETRPKHHFYDPVRDQGLRWLTVSGEKSPDWALEDVNDNDKQDYSYKDARYYLYRALTATTEEDRNKYFGLTFQSLGHVAHHVQDMAQPQHVRNDTHLIAGEDCGVLKPLIKAIDNPSAYEKYTKDLGANLPLGRPYPAVRFDTARRYWHTEDKNPGAGQGLAEFTNSNFVSAGKKSIFQGALNNGQLIATPSKDYPLPVPAGTIRYEDNANDLLAKEGVPLPSECLTGPSCRMGFVASEVKDNYKPQEGGTNARAAVASIFDQDLKLHNTTVTYPDLDKCVDPNTESTCERFTTNQVFTLNRFNFKTAHGFLLTRAVAYSAGLIDYFFRGRLEVQDAGYTDTGVSLRIKNAIDPDAEPVWKNETLTAGGGLVVAIDYEIPDGQAPKGKRREYKNSWPPVTLTEDIKPGLASAGHYSFTLPVIPDNATAVRFRLIFRGRLGKEDGAVAVGSFRPMSGFVVTPSYTPSDGIIDPQDGTRWIYKPHGVNAKWKLSPETNIKAGNVDWRGWYVNGNPTKLLTWVGARARYYPDKGTCYTYSTPYGNRCRWVTSSTTGRDIYQGGELFAEAPGEVLGAAVTRDSQGKDWLIVITLDSPNLGEVVWRRPYEKSNSADIYDPVKTPKGWQEIGRFKGGDYSDAANRINHHADVPWFFNGNGTRAQTMRRWWDTSNNDISERSDRLEISIVDDVTRATATNHKNLAGVLAQASCSSSYDIDGAGSGTSTATGNGEVLVAVDFKDTDPVLAKVKIEYASNTTSNVTVTKNSDGTKSTSGSRSHNRTQKETLLWSGLDLTIYTENSTFKSSWSSAPGTSTYSHEDKPSINYMEIGYYFDLRYGLFSYYEDGFSDISTLSINNGVTSRTGSGSTAESHHISSPSTAWGDLVPFKNTNSYTFTPSEPPTYELYCGAGGNLPPTTRYLHNFPWFFDFSVGTWAIDLNNRLLVSQMIFSDSGYKEENPYNAIVHNGGSPVQLLTGIIPGGNDKSVYFSAYSPIGVVR